MARRSKGSGAGTAVLIVFAVLAWIVQAVVSFVQDHLPEIVFCGAAGSIALIAWAIAKSSRGREVATGSTAASPKAQHPPQIAARGAWGSRKPTQMSIKTKGDRVEVPAPAVRITPIVDEAPGFRRRAVTKTPTRWVRPGEDVDVGGVRISSGMFYLGEKLPSSEQFGPERCLINPKLNVAGESADLAVLAKQLGYYPSYDELNPRARRAFLEWMASGRTDRDAPVGFIFIFFYGLEYRLLKEQSRDDIDACAAEVRRLLTIYGSNHSFSAYAARLLGVVAALRMDESVPDVSFERVDPEAMPIAVRTHLGRKLLENPVLSGEDALLWTAHDPRIWLLTPVKRCPAEFGDLWEIRFAARFPSGLRVAVPKARIAIEYRAASGMFTAAVKGPFEKLPDVAPPDAMRTGTTTITTFDVDSSKVETRTEIPSAPEVDVILRTLRELVDQCTAELDSYSRRLGRRPNEAGSPAVVCLLPQELRDSRLPPHREKVDAMLKGRTVGFTTLRNLLDKFAIPGGDGPKVPGAVIGELATVMDALDIGMEPDRRYGGYPAVDDEVCIFKAARGAPVNIEAAGYRHAWTLTQVLLHAAAADGEITADERDRVAAFVRAQEGLPPPALARLLVNMAGFRAEAAKWKLIAKPFAALDPDSKQSIVGQAAALIGASGSPSAAAVRFMERLCKDAGSPVQAVYGELHRAIEPDSPPRKSTAALPSAPKTRAIAIDADRLARLREETKAVSALLSGVFADDEPARNEAPRQERLHAVRPRTGPLYRNLDPQHSSLLAALALNGPMDRRQFDAKAREMKLFPDGAIEHINEWSFDQFDEPLIEDGDQVIIADALRKRIETLKEAST